MRKFFKSGFFNFLTATVAFGLLATLILPEVSHAGGISEMSEGVGKIADTLAGPLGKVIAIVAFALCGVIIFTQRDDLSRGIIHVVGICFAMGCIALAPTIVGAMFSFGGAVI